MLNTIINIIGVGFVGGALKYICKKNKILFSICDVIKKEDSDALGSFTEINDLVDFAESKNDKCVYVICVPTPEMDNGDCNIGIIKNVLENLANRIKNPSIVMIKSTIQPGISRELNKEYKKSNKNIEIVFVPEFLTELNANEDMYNADFALLGFDEIEGSDKTIEFCKKVMEDIYNHKEIKVICKEYEYCELFKYTINCYLGVKVLYFNEIYFLCEKLGIKYDNLRSLFQLEPRIGSSHTQIPGVHGFGFSGTCLPKECASLRFLQNKLELDDSVMESIIKRNKKIREDRN